MIDLHNDLLEIKSMLRLIIPKDFTVGYIAKQTGKSRQAVTDYITRNGEPDVDFWKKDGKIFVSEKIALQYIQRSK